MPRRVSALVAVIAGAGLMRMWEHGVLDAPAPGVVAPPLAPPLVAPPRFARTFDATRFVRGNLHAHTTRSDGDASPYQVARWYRDHGYDFVALTDHNAHTDRAPLAPLEGPAFTVLLGEEVSMWVDGKQVHVNALCTREVIAGGTFSSATLALEHAVGAVHAQGGVAIVNHPNFDRALTQGDVVAGVASGAELLEIASGHPYVGSAGSGDLPSHERLWDGALTAGLDVMGVAVDDTHHLVTDADPEAFPGVAWVWAFADAPDPRTLCDALARGALYASTGATLRTIRVGGSTYEVEPADADATVTFVGGGGRELARLEHGGSGGSAGSADPRSASVARYTLRGDEGYVRARVASSVGLAWTPAVRIVR